MKTNDIKADTRIQLRNGWQGTMFDNMRGNIRTAEVEGYFTEIGSVYSHDIVKVLVTIGDQDTWVDVEHTPAQLKLKAAIEGMGL